MFSWLTEAMRGAWALCGVLDLWIGRILSKSWDFTKQSLFVDISIKFLELAASLAKLKNYTSAGGEI